MRLLCWLLSYRSGVVWREKLRAAMISPEKRAALVRILRGMKASNGFDAEVAAAEVEHWKRKARKLGEYAATVRKRRFWVCKRCNGSGWVPCDCDECRKLGRGQRQCHRCRGAGRRMA